MPDKGKKAGCWLPAPEKTVTLLGVSAKQPGKGKISCFSGRPPRRRMIEPQPADQTEFFRKRVMSG
jgi:hypothetical protein